MSLLDAWPEVKACYIRVVKSTAMGAAGMQKVTFTNQVEPIKGVLLPASQGVRRLAMGASETVTHVLYTEDLVITGDKVMDADDKEYAVGKVTTHSNEYAEAWLNELP